jgi:hypothetical protein
MLRVITLIGGKRAETLRKQSHRILPWLVWVALATLIFVHIAFLRFTLSPAVPAAAILGAVILVAVKHLGLIASALGRLRRAAKDGKGNANDTHAS